MNRKLKKQTVWIGVITVLFSALFISAYNQATAAELSLEQAIALALQNSPEINIAGEQTIQSGFAVEEAKGIYYPQVDVFAEAGREFNDPGNTRGSTIATGEAITNNSVNTTLSINQQLFDGFKTTEEIKRRKQLVSSSEIQAIRIKEQIMMDTIEAYLSILRYQRADKASFIFLHGMDEVEKKLVLMVNAGAESPAKLKFVQARLASARQNKINILSNLASAKHDLEKIVGQQINFEAQYSFDAHRVYDNIDTHYNLAFEHNKELLVQQSDRKALEHQLASLHGGKYPTLNALVRLNQNHDVGGEIGRDRNASAMLQANFRVFDGFTGNASRNRVASQINEIDYSIDETKRDIRQRIKNLFNQYGSLSEEWNVLQQEITANDRVRSLNQIQFEIGDADILELIEGEERYFNSRVRKYDIEFDYNITIYQLMQQSGLLTESAFFGN